MTNKCSICFSQNTNKSTCPLNKNVKKNNCVAHYNAKDIQRISSSEAKQIDCRFKNILNLDYSYLFHSKNQYYINILP